MNALRRTRDAAARSTASDRVEQNLLISCPMPVPFPHHYQAWLVRTLSSRARIEAPPRPQITAGPPPEFDGDATAWSAEQLLLSALGMSVLTTFEAFAAREKVTLLAWEARVGGTVTRTETGLRFAKYIVEVDMEVSDIERAREALELTKAHCLIANSLAAPVEIDATIHLPARKAG
jgi:organic hydroperoxide reductase OsmC/OhrA